MHSQPIAHPGGPRRVALLVGATCALAALSGVWTAQAQAQSRFAAIAVAPADGAYGYGFNFATRARAESRALLECRVRANAGPCRGIVWVRNGCAAVSVIRRSDRSLRRIAWGIGNTRGIAQARARNRCGASTCRNLVWTCTSR